MTDKDRDLEQAWRAVSSEEPPKALDDAILAAAHRAVASGPRDASESIRPPRWWTPLLAAAVIGVVAVGIVQLVPNESLFETSSDDGTHAVRDKEADHAAPPAAPAPPTAEQSAPPAPSVQGASKPPSVQGASKPPSEKPAAGLAQKLAAPEPFPRKAQENAEQARQSLERKDERAGPALAAAPAPKPAAAPAPAPAAAPAPAPMSPPGRSMMRAQSDYAAAAGAVSQGAQPNAEMRLKAHDPDAWIAQIRKLRDEGRTQDALLELKEFREAVPDADRKLPADLRDWK